MTRQDYQRGAEIIKRDIRAAIDRDYLDPSELMSIHRYLVEAMVSLFEENPNFQEDLFREACRVSWKEEVDD